MIRQHILYDIAYIFILSALSMDLGATEPKTYHRLSDGRKFKDDTYYLSLDIKSRLKGFNHRTRSKKRVTNGNKSNKRKTIETYTHFLARKEKRVNPYRKVTERFKEEMNGICFTLGFYFAVMSLLKLYKERTLEKIYLNTSKDFSIKYYMISEGLMGLSSMLVITCTCYSIFRHLFYLTEIINLYKQTYIETKKI